MSSRRYTGKKYIPSCHHDQTYSGAYRRESGMVATNVTGSNMEQQPKKSVSLLRLDIEMEVAVDLAARLINAQRQNKVLIFWRSA
jgi:hypothetical protein